MMMQGLVVVVFIDFHLAVVLVISSSRDGVFWLRLQSVGARFPRRATREAS